MNAISIFRRSAPKLPPPKDETRSFIEPVYEGFLDPAPKDDDCAGRIIMLETDSISPNPSQPRKNFEGEAIARLADSIRCYGILQPLTVRLAPKPDGGGADGAAYELIAGERRLRAAKLVGLMTVPCIIIDADDRKSAELAIIENIQRENLNIFEQAGAIAALIDIYALTQEQIARQLSSSQSYVANKLRILRLTEPERRLIIDNKLTERHARALLKLQTPEERVAVLEVIIAKEMNVAAAEQYIERLLAEAESGEPVHKTRRKLILKDIRIFYNTIDRALETVKSAGLTITSARHETEDSIELVITVPKRYENVSGQ